MSRLADVDLSVRLPKKEAKEQLARDQKRHHFLWRFWPVLPGWGGMAVLDRTWYGRVLVERVEGFATEEQWQRAYDEIFAHGSTLAAGGMVLVKFWLHISDE